MLKVRIKNKGELLLILTTIIWGTTFAISKTALDSLGPYGLIATRFTMATVVGILFFWKSLIKINRTEILGGGVLGLFLTGGFLFQIVGLQYTTASKAAFLTGLAVVFVPFFEKISGSIIQGKTKVAVILAVVGTAMLSFESGQGYFLGLGDFLVLMCAVCFGGYIFVLEKVANKGNTYCFTVVQISVTAIITWILTLFFEGIPRLTDGRLVIEILYLALFATILSTVLQTTGQKTVNAQRAAVIFTLEPVFGAMFAFFVIHERFTTIQVFGSLVILGAILYNETNGFRNMRKTESLKSK
ncbi:EamA family transporter [Alkalicella caledoniensis]|uniref:EamA family transporter n=1 Tax=Alkalicella caledoniensis TaxID=2731377 RepID=A0A7G9WBR7_ALKCA|nr:EamA family transporter [Alkalicella caledoniensis]QNO16129.1 EamA family transporter [Alkalicella caledoniensis]